MKKTTIALFLSALLASNIFASSTVSILNVPFENVAVPKKGIKIKYNTQNGSQKVYCITDDFYKGWLYITENGAEKETSAVYGGSSEFIFTSVGDTGRDGDLYIFHVDQTGTIKFKDDTYKSNQPRVSCDYMSEIN